MSVSLDSWESINYTVQRFFKPDLCPYYNNEYVKILLDIIAQSIGKNSFNYVNTIVSLAEPIWHNNNTVIISLPMIQYLLDQPVKLPETKIVPVENFDIFENFNVVCDQTGTNYGADIYKNDVKTEYLVQWNDFDDPSTYDKNNSYTPITNSQIISLVMVMRLTLCVSHWLFHYKLKKKITDHKDFPQIEFANVEPSSNFVSTKFNEIESESEDSDSIDVGTVHKRRRNNYGADIDKYNPSKKYRI